MNAAARVLVAAAILFLSGCASPEATAEPVILASDCDPQGPVATPLEARIVTNLGTLVLDLDRTGAPGTVANFAQLAMSGFYEGIRFHRVVEGFIVQAGDPQTKDDTVSRDDWGTGGSDPIPDEFHDDLLHDDVGVLSMANRGPGTGSSQFFVTLAPAHHLDGGHAVFGHLREGFDTLARMGSVPVDNASRPIDDVVIEKVTIHDIAVEDGVALRAYTSEKNVAVGGTVSFLVAATNEGNAPTVLGFGAEAPPGWALDYDAPCILALPGAARVSVLTATPPADWQGTAKLTAHVASAANATASTELSVVAGAAGARVENATPASVNYLGVLGNGRLFDTSRAEIAHDEEMPKATSFCVRDVPSPCNQGRTRAYSPFEFTPGDGVLAGFNRLVVGAHEGESPAGRLAPNEGYPPGSDHPLAGRTLLFEIQIEMAATPRTS